MDGQSAVMLMGSIAVKIPQRTPSAYDTEWLHRIAYLNTTISTELKTARAKGWKVSVAKKTGADGRSKSVVTVMVKSGLPKSDYSKNSFIDEADTRRVYRFDAQSKLLESVQIYLARTNGEVQIFDLSQIDYNEPIDPKMWELQLPADVSWYEEPKKLPDNEKYASMTAEQAARAFLEACSSEDWNEAAKFDSPINEQIKQYLGGLEIVSLGKAFTSKSYGGRFVPYEIKLRPQEINMRVSNTNSAKRWVLMGHYDRKLKLQNDFKLTTEPEILTNNDAYAKLSATETVQAYFDAQSRFDWIEMRKFTSEFDVAETRQQVETAEKQGLDVRKLMPVFEAVEAFWSPEQSTWFVKCHVTQTKKWNMAIRKDNPAHRWQVDGGI